MMIAKNELPVVALQHGISNKTCYNNMSSPNGVELQDVVMVASKYNIFIVMNIAISRGHKIAAVFISRPPEIFSQGLLNAHLIKLNISGEQSKYDHDRTILKLTAFRWSPDM